MRKYLAILFMLFLALAGVVVLALFREPTLGLDLQGGAEVVYEAKAPEGRELTKADLDRSIEVIRSRVDKFGVGEPEIRKQGETQISVALAGADDPARVLEVIGQTARLEFYDLEADLVSPSITPDGFPVASTRLLPLLSSQKARADKGPVRDWYLYSEKKSLLGGPAATKKQLLTQLGLDEAPEGATFYGVPSDRIIITCGVGAVVCPHLTTGAAPDRTYYYAFKYQPNDPQNQIPEMTGEDINADGTRADFSGGERVVLLEFTDKGGDLFHDITRELAQRGQFKANQLGISAEEGALQHFAIVLDDEIRSFPTIDFRENPDGIAGGRAQITGLASSEEAEDLALVLQTGALPVDLVQVDRSDVSATLGADSLREALIAGIGGLAAVALFLLVFYRFLGLVAVMGLAIYGIFLYGAILIFNMTLTLPGFAGLILTIGVAADANIVIFERIKEEVQAGKSVRAGIGSGYRKGFNTIVDANVVTMITAFVLFAVATGGVKGFALMLLLGTLISMLTAVLATRALLGVLAGFRWFDNPSFMGASALKVPKWQRIDFVGRRNLWFAISGAAVVIGIASLGVQGLNLGIDFEGGSQLTFKTAQPLTVDEVRTEAAELGFGDAVIQGRGDSVGGEYPEFQIKTDALSTAEQTTLQGALEARFGADVSVRNVSASFSEQILRGAILAIVVSLALISLYVTLRFELKFALPVLVALFHDVLIAVGVYSLSSREVTASTVAAILTILGYSIYDTIIIFDRVRENIPLMRKSSFSAIANQSLWETIRRSLATTFITLLPVSALLLFGGDTLKDFAFALLVGIGSGAYSTIFIATPLLAVLKGREPEYEKRKEAGLQEKLGVFADPEPEPEPEPELEAEPVAAAVVSPSLEPAAAPTDGATAEERREARRKRRRARPHGRSR